MKSVEVKIKTLTPIYTGGIDGRSDQVHLQSIIGSMRWWYESIVRGYGLTACDPSFHSCLYNPDIKSKKVEQQICAVCQTFGATGYARRFHLSLVSDDALAWSKSDPINIRPPGRTRGWYLNAGRFGSETFLLTGEDTVVDRILSLLYMLEKYGSLGSKPQLGYGLFCIESVKSKAQTVSIQPSFTLQTGQELVGELPDLRTFTFFRFRFNPPTSTWWTQVPGLLELRNRRDDWTILESQAAKGIVPVTPPLKNHLRYGQQWPASVTPWLFGTMHGDERVRSRINFSWAYHSDPFWEIRGWVYFPQDNTGRALIENIRQLKDTIENPNNWLRALGLEPNPKLQAEVMLQPRLTSWKIRSTQEVDSFLRETLSERFGK